ncbi:MAG: hypothetical protein J7K22_03165 [Nanoarchaeota archaeon]|nr:hypothetical protein [Nanoarchaeota archaeon]
METSRKQKNMKYSLNKRASLSIVFSKLSLLIFSTLTVIALFFFLTTINNVSNLNEKSFIAEGVKNTIDIVSASPFNTSLNFEYKNIKFSLNKNEIRISNLKTNLSFPINWENSDKELNTSCFNIIKTKDTVIKKCR